MALENSAQTAQDHSASVPLAEVGEVAGKAETREGKALNDLKKADVEENKAETEGSEAEPKLPVDLCFPNRNRRGKSES